MSFSIRLLGGASVEGPDGPLTGRATQRHRLALLALLAASPGGVSRDKLAGYLWGDSDDERARRSLSDSMYRINKALGAGAVTAVGDELRLDPELLPSDLRVFRDALANREWQRALDAYTGPFLDGFHLSDAVEFERWLDSERDALAKAYADALEALAERRAEEADVAGAVSLWQRRAALDPYDSRLAVRLMEALDAAGNTAGALRHARVHTQLLEQEFGTDPGEDVAALVERLRGRSGSWPPRRGATPVSDAVSPDRSDRTSTPAPEALVRDDRIAAAAEPSEPLPVRGRKRSPRRHVGIGLLGGVALAAISAAWLAWRSSATPSSSGPPSIAVLPFESLGADTSAAYFAEGVAEDVMTRLSMIEGFRVIARASVTPFRGSDAPIAVIAEELGVRYVVRGSVRRSEDEVRITAQLVDTRSSTNVWAEAYDRRIEDIFEVQSDIARRVAAALETALTPAARAQIDRSPTEDLTAYNLYLRGRWFWHLRTEAGLLRSAELFGAAVARDSTYARAWAGLADALAVLAFYDYLPPGDAYPRAQAAAERALALDETLAEAHASLGYVTLYHGWDADRAEAAFRRSIELNPSYSVGHQWYANHLVATGRFEEAEREMSRAREVNPLSLIANLALGWVFYYAGRHEDAVRQCDLALEMDPDWDLGHLWRGMAMEELGRGPEALASLRRSVELSGGSGISTAALAHAHATTGAPTEARRLLSGLLEERGDGRYLPSFEIAKVYVALGEVPEAIRWLERAYEERSHSIVFLEVDPQLAPLADAPGFRDLIERVGFGG